MVHSSCRSICHSSEPQSPIIRISCSRPTCLGHRYSEHLLVRSHLLYLPSHGSPSQVDQKNQVKLLPHHCNSPRLARDALVLGPSSALNGDPSPISSVQNSFSNSPTTKYFTPINSSSNFVQKELLPPKIVNKDHLQVKVGPV